MSSSGSDRRPAGTAEQVGDRDPTVARSRADLHHGLETEQRPARLGGRRRVGEVAAERPDVPRGRRADDRGRIGDGRPTIADVRMTRELGVARRRTDPQPARGPLDAAQLRDPVQRDQLLRQRPFSLPGSDDEIGPAGDRSVAVGRGAQGIRQRRRIGEAHVHVSPRGSTRWRRTHARGSSAARRPASRWLGRWRCAMAPGVGTHGGSAMPLRPLGPAVGDGRIDEVDGDRRDVGRSLELVVEEVRVALPAVVGEEDALAERLADAHRHATVDLAGGPDGVDDRAGFVGRGDLQDSDDAGVTIDLDASRMGEERRRREGLAAEATDAAGRVDGRRRRRRARAPTEQESGTRRLGRRGRRW